jgi:uncharacterized protein (TIGR00297 family)
MEILRKVIHLSMGFFALALRWLNPWQAMLCALLAFLHNVYIFPLYGRKKLEKEEEKERGYTAIASYPAVVFALILFSIVLFHASTRAAMAYAAASWAILAFGDALGAIIGMTLKGPRLPWNREKTFAGLFGFTVFGSVAAFLIFAFVIKNPPIVLFYTTNIWLFFLATAFLAAIIESLDGQFDDNLGFPFVALSLLSVIMLSYVTPQWILQNSFIGKIINENESNYSVLLILIAINTALAVTALLKKWVSVWGFIFGLLVGFSVILSLGVKGFAILCMFYLFANFSTFYGKKVKEDRGIAEGNKGTRGLESVFSKGLAPAVFCLVSLEAFVVALAFYAADTVATEFGKTSKGKTFSLLSLKCVEPGTVGAVSIKGSAAGKLSIFVFLFLALVQYRDFHINFKVYLPLCVLVIVFFFLESIINELNTRYQLTSKMVIHITLGFLVGAFANAIMMVPWVYK